MITTETEGTPAERHAALYEKYKKYGYPKVYLAPSVGTRKLPPGKTCGSCWNFTHGRLCGGDGPKLSSRQTDYCQYAGNYFSESPVVILEMKNEAQSIPLPTEVLAGTKDELVLHALLVRGQYQCECDASICKGHKGRCTVMHRAAGGSTIFLMQPRNLKKAHSLENSLAVCVACANSMTLTKMSVPKKKKKTVENPNQQTII